MDVLDERRLGPLHALLVRGPEAVRIDLSLEADGRSWRGAASFPLFMEDEAARRLDMLLCAQDVEDLVRAWSGAETWAELQVFRIETGL